MAASKRKKTPRKPKASSVARPVRRTPPPTASLDRLLSAARLNPGDWAAALDLATYYLYQGDHDRIPGALKAVSGRLAELGGPERTRVRRLLAFGYAATREFDRAEDCIERGIEEAPNTIDLWFVRSYVAMAMGNFASAVIAGDRYLQLLERHRPGSTGLSEDFAVTTAHQAQLQNIVGSALVERQKFGAALVRFENAISFDPGNHLPYLNLIRLHERQGNREDALSVCRRGLESCRNTQELRMKAAALANHATVCACLMVKNEETHLPRCLESIRSWVDDIVVVDTGSTDRTVEIATSYGARVFHHPWEGDFSKHRNQTLDYASGDWVLIIDADEEFVEADLARLRPLLDDSQHSIISLNVFNVYADGRDARTFLPSIRLFRRSLQLRYDGIVHNQLVFPKETRIARVNAAIRHYGYGLAPEIMEKKIARTRALLEKQLAQTPDNPFALFNYAQLLRSGAEGFDVARADIVIEAAEKAVALTDPTDRTERHLHLMCLNHIAWCYLYKKDFAKALEYADRALKIRDDYLDPLFLRGHVHSQAGEFERARAAYEQYLKAQAAYNPSMETENLILLHVDSRAGAWYGLGLCEDALGNTAAARALYRKVVASRPGYLDSAARLGQLELADGNPEEARRLFEIQREQGRVNETALLGLAYLARMQGDTGRAEYYYREALGLDSTEPTALVRLARLLIEQQRFAEATDLMQACESSDDEVLRLKAQTFYLSGDYESAIPAYERLIGHRATDSGLLNDLANCFARLQRHADAEQYYRRALELNPAEIAAARNLGVTLIRLNRPQEAVRAFEQSLEHNDRQPDIYQILGDLFSAARDFGQALPLYERVLAIQPGDSLALFRVAECYLAMGHADAARLGFARVLERDPHFEPARERLARLSGQELTIGERVGPDGQSSQKKPAPLLR